MAGDRLCSAQDLDCSLTIGVLFGVAFKLLYESGRDAVARRRSGQSGDHFWGHQAAVPGSSIR